MFKVDKNIIPSNIKECFPDKRCSLSNYTMRNSPELFLTKMSIASVQIFFNSNSHWEMELPTSAYQGG